MPYRGVGTPRYPWVVAAALGMAAAAGGLAALGSAAAAAPSGPAWQLPAVAVLLLAACGRGVRFWLRGEGDRLDLFEVALAVALVALPAVPLVALVAVVKAGTLLLQRVPLHKVCFNVAQRCLAAASGSLVLVLLRAPGPPAPSDLAALVPALLVVWLVNVGAVFAAIATVNREPLRSALQPGTRSPAAMAWLNGVVNLALGVGAAALWIAEPRIWPVLLPALLAAEAAGRVWVQREAAVSRLLGVQRAAAVLAGTGNPLAVLPDFLEELRAAFECGGAELHLVEGGTCHRWGSAGPAPPAAAALACAVRRAGAAVRLPDPARPELDALLAGSGWHDVLAVPVPGAAEAAGVLLTHDREGWEGFEPSEPEVLAGAARVLGEALHRERLGRAAAAADHRWRSMVQHASDLVLVVDPDGRVTYVSPAAGRVLGDGAPLLGVPLLDRVEPLDREAVEKVLDEVRSTDRPEGRVDFRSLPALRDIEAVASSLDDGSLVLNARDVTARRQSERRWADEARVLELVARGAGIAETLAVLTRGIERQSPGSRCGVVVGPPADPTLHGLADLPAAVRVTLRDLAAGALGQGLATASPVEVGPALLAAGVHRVQVRPLRASAPELWGGLVLCHPGPPPDGDLRLLEDATRVAALAVSSVVVQDRLTHQAAHDPLTDLPNRTVFLDRLAHALRGSERDGCGVLVLFLDLDRFKVVNDSLGHRAGDSLLQAVGERLRRAVRPGDTVARFGGDEFTMLCEDIEDDSHALRLVERVRSALGRPFAVAGTEVFATGSIGIALGRGTLRAPELLVEDADAAMYRAKERGGNRYEVFDAPLRERAHRRLELQSALHRALERAEFRVVYQPTVRLGTGEVVGVEALVRWERLDHGTVLPDAFIPLAEESGLIVPLGAQVLEQALTQAARWQHDAAATQAPPPSVSVNLSPRQLLAPDLVGLVRATLDRTGVDPAGITLEITESALLHDVPTASATLDELKALGVQLFVDDFGTGYSSLTYLQRFPLDGVKVDRSFVADLGSRADASAIVRAVIGLGHSLGLVVVAEGVETAAHASHLRALDCEVGQGWYFGRPVPAEDVSLVRRTISLP